MNGWKTALAGAVLVFGAAGLSAAPLVVDTFDDDKPENLLKGPSDTWGDRTDPSIACVMSFDKQTRLGDSGSSLRLDYDIESTRQNVFIPTNVSVPNPAVVKDDVYNGYYSVMGPAPKDLRSYQYMVLSVKGDPERGFTRTFRLELKDPNTGSGVSIDGVTDQWQRYSIPLKRFKEIQDWSKVREWTVVFGPSFVTRKTGTIYIDDVYFSMHPSERIRTPKRKLLVGRPDAAPSLDGRLADWPEPLWTDMSAPEDFLESGVISDKNDFGARFAAAWDDQYLYLAVEVRDNEILNTQPSEHIWKEDCLEIYIEPEGGNLLWGNPRHFQLGFSPTSASGAPARWAWFQKRAPSADEVRSASKKDARGYTVELAVAWSFLETPPAPGKTLSFSLAAHDKDAKGRSPEAKLNWSYHATQGAAVELGTIQLQ